MANIFNINNKNILATASITITDQTDAAELAGGISVVSGSKNQVYLTGLSNPYSPDWKNNNLVLKPYLYATTITKLTGTPAEYTPDLFDPSEYPDLNVSNGVGATPYINTQDLQWFIRDANGTEKVIDPEVDFNFSYMYTHNSTIFRDKRFLVIQDNFIPKDSFATIICRFSFYDPFAKIFIKQSYEIDMSCLSTGLSTNRLVISSVYGTSIYNNSPEYIDLFASYFEEGTEIDIQNEIEDSTKNATLNWFIRSSAGSAWTLLDGSKQNDEGYEFKDLFEVRRYTSKEANYNRYFTEETTNPKGGFYLRIHPGLIDGSNIIKAVYKPDAISTDNIMVYNALEVVYDMTDDIQAYIHSSNGDKIYQGMNAVGTVLSCMLKYQGQLMPDTDERYNSNFEYYWFKISSDGTKTWNVYMNSQGDLESIEIVDGITTDLISTSRVITIDGNDVDKVNMFQCAVVDKSAVAAEELRTRLVKINPTEEDLSIAAHLNAELGIGLDDQESLLNTAYEISAANSSDE
jgi:hypothetical protein